MPDIKPKPDILPKRLCSEIQLFDLCELDSCNQRSGNFCSDPGMLSRFEKIADEELRAPERCIFEEMDDAESDELDGDGYNDNDEDDDEFAMDNLEGGEDDGWSDED